jgi:hypothetical protein
MARVALIETYPYEATWGGDAVYLDAIRCFLASRGHAVDSYVTDITRGRSKPTITLLTKAQTNHRWRVRNAASLGQNRFCSLDPRMVGKALRRLPGQRAPKDDRIEAAEPEWLEQELGRSPPDLAILAFGACAFAERIAATGAKVLALKGFFSDRRIRLGETMPTPTADAELMRSLAHATATGFNNLFDLDFYAQLSGRDDGVLVGMGFPARIQPPSDAGPAFLYVAAQTKPNIESLEWFLDQVWPAVLSAAPNAELRVAGSIGAAFAGRAYPHVSFLGFVESLKDEYRRSWAVVAPFVNGSSGVKTKIAEAISFGRPVVTTSIGVDPGAPGQYGDAVAVANDPGAFAAALLDILRDEGARRARQASATEQFFRHFTAEAAYRPILDLLEPAGDARRAATT